MDEEILAVPCLHSFQVIPACPCICPSTASQWSHQRNCRQPLTSDLPMYVHMQKYSRPLPKANDIRHLQKPDILFVTESASDNMKK